MSTQYVFSMYRLTKRYPPDKVVLENISISLLPGAKIGVLGYNGAGKSTLLKILAGVEQEFEGEAQLAPGATVGLLEQEPQLNPEKDVRGNVEDAVAEAAPPLAELLEDGAALHSGGPVQPTSVVVIAEFADPDQAGALVLENIGFVGADTDLETLPPELGRVRVYAGFAGWAPGQLESEVERDDWILAPAGAEDIFSDAPEELWSEVLERKGGQFALIARMPVDPSLN